MLANGSAVHESSRVIWTEQNQDCEKSVLVKVKSLPELQAHWPWLEKRLIRFKKKDKNLEKWQTGHIRDLIIKGFTGQSTVELYFSVAEDNSIEGFMILTVYCDPYTRLGESLVVWMLWANEELIDRYLPQLCAIAKERFLPAVEFISGRKGWLDPSKAAARGFEVKAIVYRKEVE